MRDFYASGGRHPGRASSSSPSCRSSCAASRARHRQYQEAWLLALGRLIAPEPAPLRRLRRARRHRDAVRRVRRDGVQDARPRRRCGRASRSSLRSPYGWTYTFTHLGVSQYDALNRQVTAATVEVAREREAHRPAHDREAAARRCRWATRPSSRPPKSAIRSDLREDLYIVLAGVGERDRAGGVSLHHQSAGVVGVVRRDGRGAGRTHRHVAGRRGDRGAAGAGGVRREAGGREGKPA